MFAFLRRRVFLVVVGFVLLGLFIWIAGPYFAFGPYQPLATLTAQAITFAAIVACWALFAWLKRRKASRASNQLAAAVVKQSQAEAPSADVVQLRERFEEAVASLKQKRRGRHSLYDLPWYVIIGAPGSGKTTALVNSGLHFPLEQRSGKGALRGVGGTRNCDWWFTDEAIFLDTAGRYTTQDSDAAADSAGWAEFLAQLRKYRGRRPVNGVIVAISAQDLMVLGQAGREGHIAATRRRLHELNKELRIQLPVYVLVTKCDLVAGFTEYFDDVAQEGRTQVWGVTFPYEHTLKGAAAKAFPGEFDALIGRLNERVFQRVEEERDVRRRAKVFAFPQQMAALREPITEFVTELFESTRFDSQTLLRGVYFTSGTQEGTPIDRLLGAIGRRFAVAPEAVAPGGRGKAYFIERLLKEVMLAESGLAGVNRRVEVQKAAGQLGAYAAMALAAVLGVIAFSYSYRNNRVYVDQVSADVVSLRDNPAPPAGSTLEALLPHLDAVRAVVKSAERYRDAVPWGMRWGLYQGSSIGDAARDAYSRELKASLLPQVAERIRERLRAASEAVHVYLYLKGYLMLGQPEHFDRNHFGYLADVEWTNAYQGDPDAGARLAEHFKSLLEYNESLGPITLDDALVEQARRTIPPDSLPRLVYSQIQFTYAGEATGAVRFDSLGTTSVFRRKSGKSMAEPVSSLYTSPVFKRIVSEGTAEFEKQFAADRWVWGESRQLSPTASSQLRAGVIDLYEKDYISVWDAVLADFGLAPLGDLEKTKTALRVLVGPTSPLRELLKIVDSHTYLVEPAAAKPPPGVLGSLGQTFGRGLARGREALGIAAPTPGVEITTHFTQIHELVKGEPDRAPIDGLLREVKQLQEKLEPIGSGVGQQTSNPAALADVVRAAEGLKQPRPELPPVVGGLLVELGSGVQRATRSGAGGVLSDRYQREVVSECNAFITGRYPFAQSGQDVQLRDFGQVFGYNGVFERFFKTELESWVNTAGNRWSWKLDASGQAVALLPGGALGQFEAAERIRRIFFPLGTDVPKLDFSLTARGLDSGTRTFRLEADGQTLIYRHDQQIPLPMVWPGPKPGSAAVTWEEPAGPTPNTVFTGAWALFRLIESANTVPVSSEANRLQFTKGTHSAEVLLEAGSVRNPFGKRDLFRFSCGG
jgi:type VI secretion system protein ImpL